MHREVMNPQVPSVSPELSLQEFVNDYLLRGEASCYPVMADGRLAGVVGVDEVREVPREQWNAMTVAQLAHPPAEERTVDPRQDAWDALTQILEAGSRRLLVIREGRLEGVVGQESLARLVQRKLQLGLS